VLADGPARWLLRAYITNDAGRVIDGKTTETLLPGILMPGPTVAAALSIAVPASPGEYRVKLRAERAGEPFASVLPDQDEQEVRLTVEAETGSAPSHWCSPLLEEVQTALALAEKAQRLPDAYTDVSDGWLSAVKRWVKRKVLNNFKRGYVDVLSRQQSAFNRQVLTAIAELAECYATLNSAGNANRDREADESASLTDLRTVVADLRARVVAMEDRLARLEAQSLPREAVPS
jgi:hypothetical protein